MQRVAIFGNAGGGKSTLARRLAVVTGLPLFPLDLIQFRTGGVRVPDEAFRAAHAELIARGAWIIDGFGSVATACERFARADTLIHVDLSLVRHRWWVTKRLIKGVFATPEGWPEGSPMWRSTLDSWRVTGLCDRTLTPHYRQIIAEEAGRKRVHHLRTPRAMREFLSAVGREYGCG